MGPFSCWKESHVNDLWSHHRTPFIMCLVYLPWLCSWRLLLSQSADDQRWCCRSVTQCAVAWIRSEYIHIALINTTYYSLHNYRWWDVFQYIMSYCLFNKMIRCVTNGCKWRRKIRAKFLRSSTDYSTSGHWKSSSQRGLYFVQFEHKIMKAESISEFQY